MTTYLFDSAKLFARDKLEIDMGIKVQVLSDKAFRKIKEDTFDAIGNVIIKYGEQTIYGDKASLLMKDHTVVVTGNVRYIDPEITIYSSELFYKFKTGELAIKNVRAVSDQYVVLGEDFVKKSNGMMILQDAEYTTCRDCPESWSIFGRQVSITVGGYIRIKHAYVKAKGAVIFYVPYLILPIKKERESGLLFPKLSLGHDEGAFFQIPYFWAINPNSDMTIEPFVFGERGYGSQLEYRHVFNNRKWFEINTLYASDMLYSFDNREDSNRNRLIGQYEHHFSTSDTWNHHFYFNEVSDLDTIRDFDFYTENMVKSPDVGLETFVGFRKSNFQISLDGHMKRNIIFHDPTRFDHDYVQILPKISLSTSPIPILKSKSSLLRDVLIGLDADYTVFKQNHRNENSYIRNTSRFNARPYIKVQWGKWRFLRFSTLSSLDQQYYSFDRVEHENYFQKRGLSYQTDARFTLSKIYGKAQVEKILIKELPPNELEENKDDLIEAIPTFNPEFNRNETFKHTNSYKHEQHIILRHHFLSDQKTQGNDNFYKQIRRRDGSGQFDFIDTIRSNQHLNQQRENLVTLPLSNSIEFIWNHSIIRKSILHPSSYSLTSPHKFDYKEVASLKISQGHDFSLKNASFKERLTRLSLMAGLYQDRYSFEGQEYYFYTQKKHILWLNYNSIYNWGRLNLRYDYDSLSTTGKNFLTLGAQWRLFDKYLLYSSRGFDFEDQNNVREDYGVFYSPRNNCWKINIKYRKDPFDQRISIYLLINFNDNQFQGLGSV